MGSESVTKSIPKSLPANAVWSVLSNILGMLTSFIYVPFLVNRLGPEQYGLFILLMSITGLLGIGNLGLGEATLRYVSYYYGRGDLIGINRTVSTTLFVYLLMGSIVGTSFFLTSPYLVTLFALSPNDQLLGASLLKLTAINFVIGVVGRSVSSIPQGLQRYDISTKMSIAEMLFQTIGSMLLLFMGYGIYELILWAIATTLFNQVLGISVAKHLIPNLRLLPSVCIAGIKEVFSYGIFSFIVQILGTIWSQADRLLLGTMVNSASVGYLTVPQNLSFRGVSAVNSAGHVLFPKYSAMIDDKYVKNTFLQSTWILLCTTVIVFAPVTILFPDFLRLWINADFANESGYVGQIVAASCMVRGAFISYEVLFKGIGKPQYIAKLIVLTAVTSLLVNLLLIPPYGLSGAGYCYCITPIWGFCTLYYTWKYILINNSLLTLYRIVGLPILSGLITLIVIGYIRHSLFSFIGWNAMIFLAISASILAASLAVLSETLLGREYSIVKSLFRHFHSRTHDKAPN